MKKLAELVGELNKAKKQDEKLRDFAEKITTKGFDMFQKMCSTELKDVIACFDPDNLKTAILKMPVTDSTNLDELESRVLAILKEDKLSKIEKFPCGVVLSLEQLIKEKILPELNKVLDKEIAAFEIADLGEEARSEFRMVLNAKFVMILTKMVENYNEHIDIIREILSSGDGQSRYKKLTLYAVGNNPIKEYQI